MNPKQRHRPTIAAIALLFLLHSQSALAFRCGQKIVIKDMHEIQVRKACGEPTTQRNLGVVVRGGHLPQRRIDVNGVTVERFPGYGYIVEEVVRTEYIYNFGPRKFIRRLIFEGGILVKIESMGYGYREKNPDRVYSADHLDLQDRSPNGMNESPLRRMRDQSSGKATLINEGCKISGEISGDGDFIVNGEVAGDCTVNGTVTLARNGFWQGSIHADNVIVAGQIEGDITANHKVEITNTARISGTVSGEAIAVAEGAVVEGAMKTTGQTKPLEFKEKRED